MIQYTHKYFVKLHRFVRCCPWLLTATISKKMFEKPLSLLT